MIPPEAVAIMQSLFITIAVIALGIPIIRAISRRFLDRPPAPPGIPTDVRSRLEGIEQAVDAIAIEVERISEAQRFQTKLMSELRLPSGDAAGQGSAPLSQRAKDSIR
jgi:hypothetical protein